MRREERPGGRPPFFGGRSLRDTLGRGSPQRGGTLINENLINRDYDGSFKPALAETWDTSADAKIYTFTFKKGVKFHSGKNFTSADVKYTFEGWLSIEKSPTSFSIKPITKSRHPTPKLSDSR